MADAPTVRKGKGSSSRPPSERTGLLTFYRQVIAELRKVIWPTRDQLTNYFFIVMMFVLVMIALVSLLDLGLGKLAFKIFTGADSV